MVDAATRAGPVTRPEGCLVTLSAPRPVVRVAVPTRVGMPLAAAKRELGTGVLGAVTVGLIVGRRSHEISTSASRLRGYAFWEVLVFLLNALLFGLLALARRMARRRPWR